MTAGSIAAVAAFIAAAVAAVEAERRREHIRRLHRRVLVLQARIAELEARAAIQLRADDTTARRLHPSNQPSAARARLRVVEGDHGA